MIHVHADQERSIRSVVAESKKFLYIPLSGVIIQGGTMIPEILKTENNKEK